MSLRNLGLNCLGPARGSSRRAPPGVLQPQLFEPFGFDTAQLILSPTAAWIITPVSSSENQCLSVVGDQCQKTKHVPLRVAITTVSLDRTVV